MAQANAESRIGHLFAPGMLRFGGNRPRVAGGAASLEQAIEAPDYLTAYYWWAYVHPLAVRFFERQWLVNLILGGITRGCGMRRSANWARCFPAGRCRWRASTAI